jgi:DNA replication protein DnaC
MEILTIIIFTCIQQCLTYIPYLCMLIIGILGINYYHLNEMLSETETKNVIKYISKNGYFHSRAIKESDIIPFNTFFICKKPFCVGYVKTERVDKEDVCNIYIFINKSKLLKITEKNDNKKEIEKIKVYESIGRAAWNIRIEKIDYYHKPKFTPHKKMIDNIIKKYHKNCSTSLLDTGYIGCLFYGQPGTGKSSIGYNIAIKLSSSLLINYDPTTLGLNIRTFLSKHNYSVEKPLVIIINEFDKIVKKCFDEIENKTEYLRDAYSKPSLNNLLDVLTMKKGIILICNSNENLEWFKYNKYDSVIRDGRFHIREEIGSLSNSEIKELNKMGYKCNGLLSDIT